MKDFSLKFYNFLNSFIKQVMFVEITILWENILLLLCIISHLKTARTVLHEQYFSYSANCYVVCGSMHTFDDI